MDIHVVEDEAFDEIAAMKGHHKDIAVQSKFGVTSLKYFLNLSEKKVFCLLDAPNKKACENVHLAAHGIGACNVIELSSEIDFKVFLGEGAKDENDMALTLTGEIDTGYRSIIMICPVFFEDIQVHVLDKLYSFIETYEGKRIALPEAGILVSFVNPSQSIAAVKAIRECLDTFKDKLEYNLALVTGKPVDEKGNELFEEAKRALVSINDLGTTRTIHIDSVTLELAGKIAKQQESIGTNVRKLTSTDLAFYAKLWNIFNEQIQNADFTSVQLSFELGLSKTQSYRKIKALTEMAPNQLIREMRLRRSLRTLKNNNKTVAEIAYEFGFNSPTYFTRVFRKRYKILPTEFAKLANMA
ncbi:DUF4242 domain-containing protein [Aurantibacter crassamenti]|uniref:nickel-binding protein n=1 Tax=Aurantibacter crassamenti TaxID=1837375 RepID=UPI00193A49D9|nr:nickel-binding protein [Aurantibacter crassamenti]MBM1105976.1 DUF4242 domain-containing protein [Aurantibacter crassamenti]